MDGSKPGAVGHRHSRPGENLVDDPIAAEAQAAAAHFGYRQQATYIILTPPTSVATGEPASRSWETHPFAAQPLWSNQAYDATGNGCAVSR